MPYLGDYLGHVLAEITTARVQADLEAVRVAELYANHPLLRHMAVPRFRIPTLTVDVPVALRDVEKPLGGGMPVNAWRPSFDRLLDLQLERVGAQLSEAQRTEVNSALEQATTRLSTSADVPPSPDTLAEALSGTVAEALRGTGRTKRATEPPWLGGLVRDLTAAARTEFVRLQTSPPRLQVLATAAELREAGPPERLIRLHLSISEDAFEWTAVESNGKTQNRLVPE